MGPSGALGKSGVPPEIDALMVAANGADRRRDPISAVRLCGQILAIDPGFVPARVLSAVIHLKSGHLETAERKLLRILDSNPDCFPAYLWLGTMYSRSRRNLEAISFAQKAVSLKPRDKDAQLLLGRALFEEGKLIESRAAFEEALAIQENIAEAHSILGSILQQLGDLAEAETHLLRAIELEPHIGPPYFDLVMGRKIRPEDRPLLDRFELNGAAKNLPPRDRSRIEFALGKASDDLGDYESAMKHYDQANRLALEVMNRSGVQFDSERLAEDFRKSKLSSSFASLTPSGSDSETPVFIVGMMRSGTTLLEQILSSHRDVAGGGELNYWLRLVSPFQNEERVPSGDESRQIATGFLKLLRQFGPGKARVIDKTPHNFIGLGCIHAILPNARIVHCRRPLVDSCLSIYMTPFRVAPEFAHSRENIVEFAKRYESLMEHWRRVLPADRFLELDYEELVADPEDIVRKAVEFLGLPWDEACLRHDLNPKAVRTPSLWQVRQPLYSGSIARWRRYEPWLGAFKELIP